MSVEEQLQAYQNDNAILIEELCQIRLLVSYLEEEIKDLKEEVYDGSC
jgi:hypothetical protein